MPEHGVEQIERLQGLSQIVTCGKEGDLGTVCSFGFRTLAAIVSQSVRDTKGSAQKLQPT